MTPPTGPRPVPWIATLAPATHGSVDASTHGDGHDLAAVLDFSVNGNVVGPPPAVAAALTEIDLSQYPDRGALRLRHAIAERDQFAADDVVVGNGSSELIWAVARAYLAPGDLAAVLTPTYGEYEVASRATGARVDFWPPTPFERSPGGPLPTIDPAEVSLRLERGRPRLLWLCHPNNPTGAPGPIAALGGWIKLLPETLFVVDEAYLTLSKGLQSAASLISHGNVVVLRSLTKDVGLAGLRVGYLLAAPEIADVVRRALPPWSVSSVAQAGALAAIADWPHLERARSAVAASRAHLVAGLKRLGLHAYSSSTSFVLVSVGAAQEVTRQLWARGLAVRDCTSFGLPDCIRVGVRSIPDQERLLAALTEVIGG